MVTLQSIYFIAVNNNPTKALFYSKVMFVELNRDESQKYLDQMKQDVASISRNNSSTLSCGGSFQSFAGSPLQNQGSSTGFIYLQLFFCLAVSFCYLIRFNDLNHDALDSGRGNHWQGSHSHIFPSNYGMPSQVSWIYLF